jgi:hypothetical protein
MSSRKKQARFQSKIQIAAFLIGRSLTEHLTTRKEYQSRPLAPLGPRPSCTPDPPEQATIGGNLWPERNLWGILKENILIDHLVFVSPPFRRTVPAPSSILSVSVASPRPRSPCLPWRPLQTCLHLRARSSLTAMSVSTVLRPRLSANF